MSRGRMLGAVTMLVALTLGADAGEGTVHYTRERIVAVSYRVKEGLAAIERVELWYTTDGGRSWKLFGVDRDNRSPVGFKAPRDGTYGFKVISVNKAGLSDPKPSRGTRPDVTIAVDTSAPKIVYTGPAGGVQAPGAEVEVTYTVSDANLAGTPISVDYSVDRGASWRELASGLRSTGTAKVKLPGKHGDNVLMRVMAADKANNSAMAKSARAITVDGKPPVVSVTGPRSASGNRITVTYRAQDVGKADLAEVKLYVTTDAGRTWRLAGGDRDLDGRMPFEVTKPATYGFHVVGVDKAGNASAAPVAGTEPMHLVVMDTQAPTVAVLSLSGGAFAGGTRQQVIWKATDDNMAPAPITIEYSSDGGREWKVIARRLPNTGKYLWSVPKLSSDKCMVRIEATDTFGNRSYGVTEAPFVITTEAPSTTAFFDPNQQGDVVLAGEGVVEAPVEKPIEKPIEKPVEKPVVTPDIPLPVAKPKRVPQAKLDEAAKMLDSRRYGDAAALMTRELGRAPESSPALALRGRAYLGLRKTPEALRDLNKAIGLDEGNRQAWLQLGVAHFRVGKDAHKAGDDASARTAYGKAALAYENAIRIAIVEGGQGAGVEYYYCGMAYYQLYGLAGTTGPNGDKALERLRQALSVGGQRNTMGGTCWYLAKLYESKGQKELAKQYWKKCADYFTPGSDFHKKAMENYKGLGGK